MKNIESIGEFDGKLTEKEIELLRESNLSEKQIQQIDAFLNQYKSVLSGFSDLVGDAKVPINNKQFLFNMKHIGYLLDNDPEKVMSKQGVEIRKLLHYLFKVAGPKFLACPQVIENRNVLRPESNSDIPDSIIEIPKNPVIWMPNHYFKDDALSSVIVEKRDAYILFASLPQFFNTVDGLTSWLNGVILFNRKVEASRNSVIPKCEHAIDLGADLHIHAEGVWNKSPNEPLLELWPGFYRIAKDKGTKIVPVIHYIEKAHIMDSNNLIHTVVDNPISVEGMSENAAREHLREVMTYWYYLMMEKYGQSTREKELNGFSTSKEAWEYYLKERIKTADRYDTSIETTADYRPNGNLYDPWENIANLEGISTVDIDSISSEEYSKYIQIEKAKKMVKELKENDFQRRF